ncbi:hypothetical protein QMK24_38185 [Streptomyces sp. PH10-H1]|uniref:hypothetical protein n=1 Tax=Streptomyces sp. H10-C2 TaxID=3046210 RepID=UPI0024BA2BF7|nr:hypothetical protein [Streptomyces sp. H10-C2]MDJ0347127.1 hypothetical protein [Streptomyces sp. PH10-H1]
MRAWRRVRPGAVPGQLKLLRAVVLTTAFAFLAALVSGGALADSAWSDIRDRSEPQVVSATGLYFTLNDMDAQVANQLMLGDTPKLSSHRTQAAKIYDRRRTEAGGYLRDLAEAAAGDPAAEKTAAGAITDLGSYEELASRALLLGEQSHRPAGDADPRAVAAYRTATDLMRTQLLPEADRLVTSNDQAFGRTYQDAMDGLSAIGYAVLGTGLLLLAALVGLQLFLAARFRRVINPLIALGTAVTLALLIAGMVHTSGQREQLRVARHDAFDSVVALDRARAVSYDANADESRYLLDRSGAAAHEADFFAKSQTTAGLPNADLSTYNGRLSSAMDVYRADHDRVDFSGAFGAEFRNITFTGERAAAETVMARYQDYQRDDRKIRDLAASGHLADAIAYCTSYEQGGSNRDFGAYDTALQNLIGSNENAFQHAATQGSDSALTLPLGLAGGVLAVAALTIAGVRPRLAEFR